MFPEGAQDPLQRREEAGNEAKVPTLRGEDGYVSFGIACPVAGPNLGLGRSDNAFLSAFAKTGWQVLGTLPESLRKGMGVSLAGPSEPVLVRIQSGRRGLL